MEHDLSALAAAAQAGSKEALDGLVRAVQRPVYNLALRMLQSSVSSARGGRAPGGRPPHPERQGTLMSTTSPGAAHAARPIASPWRSAGLWMSAILIGYLFFNVVRATLGPADFAATFGIPLENPGDNAFVLVYAIRTLFLALFGLALLLRRSYASLALFLLVAVVMPLGDALLVAQRGGEPAIIARHLIIAAIVLLTWFLTWRWARRSAPAA